VALSARPVTATVAAVLPLAALSGCSTTQQEAARLQLNSARIRASQLAVRVTRANPHVRVDGVELLAGRDGSAVVVRVRNLLAHPISDLPISVGVRAAGGHKLFLNGAAGSDYFVTHVPAIAAGATLTWVFTTRRSLPPGARPFAVVGVQVPPLVSGLRSLPRIAASAAAVAPGGRGAAHIRVTVRNLSSVPQYELQVYFIARRSGRVLSAGRATIAHLGTRASASLNVQLVGNPAAAAGTLEASPTIFG